MPPHRTATALLFAAALSSLVCCPGCHPVASADAPPPETGEQCAERLHRFGEDVARLPDRSVASAARDDLPVSTLGAQPGPGPVLEVSEGDATVDGVMLEGATAAERAARLGEWASRTFGTDGATTKGSPRPAVYVVTSAGTDVQTLRVYFGSIPASVDLRLLVRLPKAPAPNPRSATRRAEDPATELLLEPDPARRAALAEAAYGSLADCPPLAEAAASVRGRTPVERWPALKAALRDAIPRCQCSKVDTAHLLSVVSAEQQAGAGALGYVPASFLRDERCGASMPLRSMQKLMRQLEQFDAEFAGTIAHDAFEFGNVVTDDRLRVYFCNALPGETLAAKERARSKLYLRTGGDVCESWQFEPLSPGSPMGTLRRVSGAALAYHYWQAAEELRVYGPVDPASPTKPTDHRDWACEETYKLTGIEDDAIDLSDSRWYFDEAACRRAKDQGRASLCAKPAGPSAEGDPAPPPSGSAGHR
jgi:hypothetical protein